MINRLLEFHDLAKQEARKYRSKRFLFSRLVSEQGRHFIGIVGARGTGKTTLLRQYALEHTNAFYLSADSLDHDDNAWEVIRSLKQHYGFQTFLLDEIHFLPDHTALLKRLYDFVDIRVLFSSREWTRMKMRHPFLPSDLPGQKAPSPARLRLSATP